MKESIFMQDFKNKKIIITGASRGLGLVCAQAFSKLGAQIALLARDEVELNRVKASCNAPEKHLVFPIDLLDYSQIPKCVEKIYSVFGSVDVVLHVAGGGLGLKDPLLDGDSFLKLFKLNVGAVAELNRYVVPRMKQQGFGNLVHVGSIASFEAVASVGYNSVKSALAAYVRSLGRTLAPDHIIVTGIAPGGFCAPKNAMERLAANNPNAYQEFISERLPRGIMGDAQELLPMIFFLSSQNAAMMCGCMVPMDGGEGKTYT